MLRCIARLWVLAVVMAVPALLMPPGAGAIIGGSADGAIGHPNVGFILAVDQAGRLADACTGTLISSTAVLTAAHCLADGERYFVSFDPTVDLTTKGNTFLPTAGFRKNDQYDVGVLRLAQATTIEPAELPDLGVLDQDRKGTAFTHVGYGMDSPPSQTPYDYTHFTRRTLMSSLTKVTGTQLSTRSPDGSLCKGDSGGPVFSGDGAVVALGNYANAHCQGQNSGPRLDIEPVRSFLRQ